MSQLTGKTDMEREVRGWDFDPITLGELTERAELMTRIDRKYVLLGDELPRFLEQAPSGTRVLTIDGADRFGYESTYFDTPELDSYRQAAWGRSRRWKVRTRDYLDTGSRFVEVKTRRGEHSSKQRVIASPGLDRGALDNPARRFVADVLHSARIEGLEVDDLRPVLRSRYARQTLLAPDGSARITIDTELAWAELCGARARLRRPDLVVVETKTAGAPTVFDQALWRLGHRPQRISKYATGLAALEPSLPHNRWSRTLRHHFR